MSEEREPYKVNQDLDEIANHQLTKFEVGGFIDSQSAHLTITDKQLRDMTNHVVPNWLWDDYGRIHVNPHELDELIMALLDVRRKLQEKSCQRVALRVGVEER